ncbi:chondroitin sulfate proteoglycan 4-like [Varroa jacobsoni]|uniref:chondroitin sulfate proteoglycan 4-like n=1 Tax=Varroa jacobsoni TaxID=62625 RepID=UPI000BFA5869|nr:chondroitin sulfate proteoglycan 4-like [Varroa jacobsoni]
MNYPSGLTLPAGVSIRGLGLQGSAVGGASSANACGRAKAQTSSASFYGSSFASLSVLTEGFGGVDTRFRFKTRSEDALLLLIAGGSDYCTVELKRGALKVRLKLGGSSKEFAIISQEGSCNDLRWHEVSFFYKAGHNVSVTLDQQFNTHPLHLAAGAPSSLDIPGQKSTVYVGGLGGYAGPLSTGRPPSFRGCIESLYYNNVNVFHRALTNNKKSDGVLYEVEFGHRCPVLFEATNSDAISFTDGQQSFVALPTIPGCSGGLQLNLQFQTSSPQGLLAYQSGRRSVLALELDDGRVNLIFKRSGELNTLTSPQRVSDAYWHKLQIEMHTNGSVIFYVDTSKITWDANYTRGERQSLAEEDCSFDTHFYIGGVDAKNRQRAQAQGVKPYQYSLSGCVHYMRLNGKIRGLENALVTKSVSKGCVWKYPCLKEPCVDGADCLQVGIDSFQCVCDTAKICTKKSFTANYKETYATSADDDSPSENVLAITPVVVHDGGIEHLSPEHIHLLVDLQKLGLRPGDIHFSVLVGPHHGSLAKERLKTSDVITTFTYRDISRYRVVYTHDGSEAANDSIVLEMSVAPSTLLLQRLPKALSEKIQFMLHIAILAQQNSPTHDYDTQVVFTLARHTKKQLTNDLLKIDDVQFVDEGAARFMVHIEEAENTGFVDNFKNPGVALDNFTFHDLKQSLIWYNHRGNASSTSFGLSYNSPSMTKEILVDVRTFPLDITSVNNTGVKVSHATPTIMTNQMLAFVTNAPEQGLDIRFDIATAPKYGTIQRLKSNSVWTNTTHFSQRQLTRHKVRFVPTPQAAIDKPVEDALVFTVSCEKAKLSTLHQFTLSFTSDRVFAATNNTRVVYDTRQIVLTERDLRYLDGYADSRIAYTLTATPKLGRLLLNGVVLSVGSNFTQRHLAQKNLVYRPSKSVIFFEDSFKFNVFSSNPATAGLTGQTFTLRSANSDLLIVANMRVPEGERLAFKLAKESPKKKLVIKITGEPSHGAIERSEEKGQFRVVTEFSAEAVAAGEVFYKHDDSESARDKVVYDVVKENSTEVLQTGEVNIDISLKNDNPPRRTQEQVFHIAYQAEKILSNMHLRYEDADTDTDPSKITISRKEIPNAMLVRNDDSRKEVQQFTQKDIDDEMILVRHTGGDYGRAIFWISDGQFYATGILEIVASPPYLNITTNTGLLLEQGSSAPLLPSNLSIDTNLNVKPSEVVLKVMRAPTLGKLRFAQSSEQVINKFTMRDVQEGIIEYVHTSPSKAAYNDRFDFNVVALGVTKEASFKITVYPSTFWTPMQLKAGGGNATLYLDAGSIATVSRTYLNVIHETLEPEDIMFSLARPPRLGQLLINGKPITSFTQTDVNKGSYTLVYM